MKGTPNHILLVVGIIPCVLVALGALLVVPQFNDVFVNFGTSIPLATRILLATFRWWGIAALITVALYFFWPTATNRGMAAAVFGAIASSVLFAFGVYACYAPIFALARIVD